MKKFNYVKWKSNVLPGLLTEQIGTSSIGGCNPFTVGGASSTNPPCCYICNSGSSLPIQGQQTGPAFEMNWGGGYFGFSGSQGQCMVTGSYGYQQGMIDPNATLPGCQSGNPGGGTYLDCISYNACTGSAGTGSCSTSWSNYSNWVSTWTNNGAFQNPNNNPNQPCNHICQKIQQWTNMGSGTIPLGPVQDNIVQCKLAEGQNQSQIHGCNC